MSILRDMVYRRLVGGLSDYDWGGAVVIKDAKTGEVKRVIENPPNYDEIIAVPANIRKRISNKRDRKKKP